MKKQLAIATIGTAVIGGGIFYGIRKAVKNSQFAELMLAIKQDEAQTKGDLSYLKGFDPSFASQPDPLKRTVILYTTAKVETLVDGLRSAMKGIGTDEASILSIYNSIESQQKMSQIAKRYAVKYGKDLLGALNGELDKGERSQLFAIVASKPEVQYQ